MTKTKAVLGALLLASIAAPAMATTLVDTGPQSGNGGGGPTLAQNQFLAGRFTLGAAATLTDLQGYIASYGADTIRVSLRADSANLPGAALYSATFVAAASGGSGAWQGVTGQAWAVGAGSYWVSFDNQTGSAAYMPTSAPNPLASYAITIDSGASWFNSNLNFGLRVQDNATAAVPEPATWAMMVMGFGAVGFALRRRRAVAFKLA